MKGFTVSQVRAAVKKNGFPLAEGVWGQVENGKVTCGCVLTQLYCASHDEAPIKDGNNFWGDHTQELDSDKVSNWANRQYGKTYAQSVIEGFDDGEREDLKEQYKGKLRSYALRGFDAGQRARNLLDV